MSMTPDQLRQILSYDAEAGRFFWLVDLGRAARVGVEANQADKGDGYRRIKINGKHYAAHRLALCLAHGAWPAQDVDHINGDRSDNRLANLREVSHKVNMQNQRKPRADNPAKLLGVGWHKASQAWRARITIDGKQTHLGLFKTAEEAAQAHLNARRAAYAGNTL
jgi:hypothetical protein